jgi:type IV secretion system protein VirB10
MTNNVEPDTPRPKHDMPDPSAASAGDSPRNAPAGTATGTGNRVEPADRGMPDLNQRGRRSRGTWLTPLAIGVVAIVGAMWTVHGLIARHDADAKARRDSATDQPTQGRRFGDTPSAPTPASAVVPADTPTAPASAPLAVVATQHGPTTPVRSYYDAPLMATGEEGSGTSVSGPASLLSLASSVAALRPGGAAGTGNPASQSSGQSGSPLAQALTPTATLRVTAGLLGDRNFILAQGAKIDCVGDTAFDSTEAGLSTCTVTKNVYSDNGHVLLIERGSQVNSEYRANIAPGARRVFILSARIRTPEGVTVEIDSPAADALGRVGVGGYVNNHWGERLGAAFMLSLVQDSIGYFSTRGGNANGEVEFQNTEQAGDNMSSKVLDSTINIPPTLKQNQGAEFTIVVARDLDFSSVYALQPE